MPLSNKHNYEPLSSHYVESRQETKLLQFIDVLKPVLGVNFLFGQSRLSNSMVLLCVSKLLFIVLLTFITTIFALAVFKREKIDIWIQFSLYITPLLCIPVGAYIFGSSAYNRMLRRNITNAVSVRFFVNNGPTSGNGVGGNDGDVVSIAPAHNAKWLREIAIKSLFYPLLLQVLQWGAFLVFFLDDLENEGTKKDNSTFIDNFVGKIKVEFLKPAWKELYITNWFLTVYIVGYVSYQFVFVTRLIIKDTVHLMSLFGKTSYLQIYPVYKFAFRDHCAFKFFNGVANFLTMDLFNSYFDEKIYTDCADISRDDPDSHLPVFIPSRTLHSPFDANANKQHERLSPTPDHHNHVKVELESETECKMSPAEACELFSTFIAEAESLTSVFVPFTCIITFFGMANLITHVGLFIKNEDGHHLTAWTMFRTVLFLFVAVRMLLCVQRVSAVLGKLPPHINLIHTAGKLGYKDNQGPSWKDFIELLSSYNLGKRSFGFPMTLRQIASFVAIINMAFLIVFSVVTGKSM